MNRQFIAKLIAAAISSALAAVVFFASTSYLGYGPGSFAILVFCVLGAWSTFYYLCGFVGAILDEVLRSRRRR